MQHPLTAKFAKDRKEWNDFFMSYLKDDMSQAFVRESDEQWLHDVSPTLNALIVYLTRENNGIRVYLQKSTTGADGRELQMMSNGLSYAKDASGKWEVVW